MSDKTKEVELTIEEVITGIGANITELGENDKQLYKNQLVLEAKLAQLESKISLFAEVLEHLIIKKEDSEDVVKKLSTEEYKEILETYKKSN